MKLTTKIKTAMLSAVLAAPAAFAGTINTSDAFSAFHTTVKQWATGPLGMGLATTMLLMGGAIGVAKNTPMPALTGIAGAAFLHWGPDIITSIMANGLLV